MVQQMRAHGVETRGLTLARGSSMFEGRFGRMFRTLPPAEFGNNDDASQTALTKLGAAMSADLDPPKDGPDAEESGIPAAFTYFGQFIDHDLTFDPISSLQRQNDPDALVDFRSPRFDLDSVYGRGPTDQPYLYTDGTRFVLGTSLDGHAPSGAFTAWDLPRSTASPARAIIGDPRNDENVIVSQLQGLFLRFHNRLADELSHEDPHVTFETIQREVRFHYQWVVLNDFLPRIVHADVLHAVLPHLANGTDIRRDPPRLRDYHFRNNPFMPLEFAVAAYRFGHSMIRPGYRLNDAVGPLPIFPLSSTPDGPALTGFGTFPSGWAIDWARFLDLEPRPYGTEGGTDEATRARTQLAYRIDTSLVNPLSNLPAQVVGDPPPSLAERNLKRSWRLRLPNGQQVARAMGLTPLADKQIVIGKFTGDSGDVKGDIVAVAGKAFANNCPLWTYVLAETQHNTITTTFATTNGDRRITTPQLGPVGGRIVTETFAGLLTGDNTSFPSQNPLWRPRPSLTAHNGTFGLRELVAAAIVD